MHIPRSAKLLLQIDDDSNRLLIKRGSAVLEWTKLVIERMLDCGTGAMEIRRDCCESAHCTHTKHFCQSCKSKEYRRRSRIHTLVAPLAIPVTSAAIPKPPTTNGVVEAELIAAATLPAAAMAPTAAPPVSSSPFPPRYPLSGVEPRKALPVAEAEAGSLGEVDGQFRANLSSASYNPVLNGWR